MVGPFKRIYGMVCQNNKIKLESDENKKFTLCGCIYIYVILVPQAPEESSQSGDEDASQDSEIHDGSVATHLPHRGDLPRISVSYAANSVVNANTIRQDQSDRFL